MKLHALLLGLLTASATALAGPTATEQQLIDLENAWGQAYINRDVAALEKLFAEEYLFTDHDGHTEVRADEIAAVKSGDFRMTTYHTQDVKVHVYKDIATTTGVVEFTATYKGEDASCRCRFTDVYVKRDGRWQAVASHVSKIAATP